MQLIQIGNQVKLQKKTKQIEWVINWTFKFGSSQIFQTLYTNMACEGGSTVPTEPKKPPKKHFFLPVTNIKFSELHW